MVDRTKRGQAAKDLIEGERRYREARVELANVNRVAAMEQFAASIAHEISQPIAASVTNAQAALRWLTARPPNVEEARTALTRIIKDGGRAGDVMNRMRASIKRASPRKEVLAINETILEVLALMRADLLGNDIAVRTRLTEGLSPVHADRAQLRQVLLNLIVNAVEAMAGRKDAQRDLTITTERTAPDGVLVSISDSGPDPERSAETVHATAGNSLATDLPICRYIIGTHDGTMSAIANVPRGVVVRFTLPAAVSDGLDQRPVATTTR